MKKALIQDNFIQNGGAERCIESITNVWNDFDVFSLVDHLNEEDRNIILKGKYATTSFIQNLPFSKKLFRHYLPFYPLAIEQLDLSEYDLILSSSYSVAKGVMSHANQIHVTYMHSPVRYAWDLYFQYLKETNLDKGIKSVFAKIMLHYLRIWDQNTANRPDYYIANSNYIAKRIKKIYNKEAAVIYPPVDTKNFTISNTTQEYYFTYSRMVPYKKIDLIVEAFNYLPNKKLIVAGEGPEFNKIKNKASKNIEFIGFVPKKTIIEYLQKCKAFIFAAEEDFGITPIEAQACGIPVIAFGKGGVLETINGVFPNENKNNPTGIFFKEQTIKSLIESIDFFEKSYKIFNPELIRQNALRFDSLIFENKLKSFIDDIIERHNL